MRKTAAIFVASLALGACGAESQEDHAKAAAIEFLEAAGSGKGDKACSLLDAKVRRQLEVGKFKTCARLVKTFGAGFNGAEVETITVEDRRANVELANSKGFHAVVKLVKDGEAWRVTDMDTR